jgi:hypothetical protein
MEAEPLHEVPEGAALSTGEAPSHQAPARSGGRTLSTITATINRVTRTRSGTVGAVTGADLEDTAGTPQSKRVTRTRSGIEGAVTGAALEDTAATPHSRRVTRRSTRLGSGSGV